MFSSYGCVWCSNIGECQMMCYKNNVCNCKLLAIFLALYWMGFIKCNILLNKWEGVRVLYWWLHFFINVDVFFCWVFIECFMGVYQTNFTSCNTFRLGHSWNNMKPLGSSLGSLLFWECPDHQSLPHTYVIGILL
jgi:hypothetical protein